MRPRALIVLVGCGRIGFDPNPDLASDAPSPVRSELRLDRVAPGEPLVDFVLPVVLDETRADLARLSADTLHVYAGTTELAVEVETEGPPFVAWVRIPRIEGTTTTLTVEYGSTPATPSAAWSSDYGGVWHMTGGANDSSPFTRNGVETALGDASGVIGRARAYTRGQEPCIVVSQFADLAFNQATLSGWITLNADNDMYYAMLTRQLADTPEDDFFLGIEPPGVKALGALRTESGGSPTRIGSSMTVGTWHHLVFSFDGASSAIYIDGVRDVNGPASGQPGVSPSRPLFIGCGRNSTALPLDKPDGDYIDGALDEVRFETIGRTQAWIAYEYSAQQDLVISYGAVER